MLFFGIFSVINNNFDIWTLLREKAQRDILRIREKRLQSLSSFWGRYLLRLIRFSMNFFNIKVKKCRKLLSNYSPKKYVVKVVKFAQRC